MKPAPVPSILTTILQVKRGEITAARHVAPIDRLTRACAQLSPARGLRRALSRAPGQPVRLIAEIKRASPSAGAIRAGANPADIGRMYESAGASAISVLTDRQFFDGDLAFLARVRTVTSVPLLRKDFIIDPYQVVEARAAGADGVLLIAAALDGSLLAELMACSAEVGLDSLVEVHDVAETERALAAGAQLLGVNHRDLATFTIDMTLTERLARLVPDDVVLVGESGIRAPEDVLALGRTGAHAVLVGERLMRADDPGAAARALSGLIPETERAE